MSTSSALSKYKFLGLFPLVMAQIGTSGDNSVLTVATASLLASLKRQCQTSSWPTLFILCAPAA